MIAVDSNSLESSIHDSAGDVFVRVESTTFGNGVAELWYGTNVVGGADTVTVSHTGAIAVAEYSGVMSIDTATAQAGLGSKIATGPAAPPAAANDLVLGVGGQSYAGTGYSAGSGFALRGQAEYNWAWCIALEDTVDASTAAPSMSLTSGAWGYFGAIVAAFHAG